MKIYDCFMYFDEDLILDLRLNYLSKYVDKFVIVESKYNHKGEKRKLQFDEKKFKIFSDKIIYIESDKIPDECLFNTSNDCTNENTTPSYAPNKISPDFVE